MVHIESKLLDNLRSIYCSPVFLDAKFWAVVKFLVIFSLKFNDILKKKSTKNKNAFSKEKKMHIHGSSG
jgi:hypothetical protein